jgi:ketosteroid isomerase-like protein
VSFDLRHEDDYIVVMSDARPELPGCIDTYQQAHDRRDTQTALATFTDGATVIDEDTTYVGTEAIRGWLDTAASEFTYTRTLLGAEALGGGSCAIASTGTSRAARPSSAISSCYRAS